MDSNFNLHVGLLNVPAVFGSASPLGYSAFIDSRSTLNCALLCRKGHGAAVGLSWCDLAKSPRARFHLNSDVCSISQPLLEDSERCACSDCFG